MGRKPSKNPRIKQSEQSSSRDALLGRRLVGAQIPERDYFDRKMKKLLDAMLLSGSIHRARGTTNSELLFAVNSYRSRVHISYRDEKGNPFDPKTLDECISANVVMHDAAFEENGIDPFRAADKRVSKLLHPPIPLTVGELLCLRLRAYLQRLKAAERAVRIGQETRTPVRGRKMLRRSTVADLAMNLLEDCMAEGCPPGPQLTLLMRDLLNIEMSGLSGNPKREAWHEAAAILAISPAGVRELAKRVGVSPSTISAWKKDSSFCREINRLKRELEYSKAGDLSSTSTPQK